MQMINVLQRLAELDANNSNVITEMEDSTAIREDVSSVSPTSNHPANINITAGSGEEVGSMLAAIMKLAGVEKVGDEHMGVEHEPAIMTAEPSVGVMPSSQSAGTDMRAVLDKINDTSDEKETDEAMYDNSPDENVEGYDSLTSIHADANKNPAMGGDTLKNHDTRSRVRNQPTATMEQQLMDEYKEFVVENDLASQVLGMAKKVSPNARLRGSEAEEKARRDEIISQRTNTAVATPTSLSHEEREELEHKLHDLESRFDPHYEHSDDYTFWSKQKGIASEINRIKQQLSQSENAVIGGSMMEDRHESGEEYHSDSMAVSNLETIAREVAELSSILNSTHELPDWVEDKIAQVKGMVVSMSEYMKSETNGGDEHEQHGNEHDPQDWEDMA